MRLIVVGLTLLLVGCSMLLSGCATPGGAADIPVAEHTVTERRVYVPIDAALTRLHPIEDSGPLSDAPRVAAERKKELLACNADKLAIQAIQGTPANPPKKDEKHEQP